MLVARLQIIPHVGTDKVKPVLSWFPLLEDIHVPLDPAPVVRQRMASLQQMHHTRHADDGGRHVAQRPRHRLGIPPRRRNGVVLVRLVGERLRVEGVQQGQRQPRPQQVGHHGGSCEEGAQALGVDGRRVVLGGRSAHEE